MKPRVIKCKAGHKWTTTKSGDWFLLEFKDAAGFKVLLKACPVCFVQWVTKNVNIIESYAEPEPEVDSGAKSSSGSSSSPDAPGSPRPEGSTDVQPASPKQS